MCKYAFLWIMWGCRKQLGLADLLQVHGTNWVLSSSVLEVCFAILIHLKNAACLFMLPSKICPKWNLHELTGSWSGHIWPKNMLQLVTNLRITVVVECSWRTHRCFKQHSWVWLWMTFPAAGANKVGQLNGYTSQYITHREEQWRPWSFPLGKPTYLKRNGWLVIRRWKVNIVFDKNCALPKPWFVVGDVACLKVVPMLL